MRGPSWGGLALIVILVACQSATPEARLGEPAEGERLILIRDNAIGETNGDESHGFLEPSSCPEPGWGWRFQTEGDNAFVAVEATFTRGSETVTLGHDQLGDLGQRENALAWIYTDGSGWTLTAASALVTGNQERRFGLVGWCEGVDSGSSTTITTTTPSSSTTPSTTTTSPVSSTAAVSSTTEPADVTTTYVGTTTFPDTTSSTTTSSTTTSSTTTTTPPPTTVGESTTVTDPLDPSTTVEVGAGGESTTGTGGESEGTGEETLPYSGVESPLVPTTLAMFLLIGGVILVLVGGSRPD